MPPKRKCIFNELLEKEYPFIKKTSTDSDVRCSKCYAEFSIASSGRWDISQHLKSVKHKKADIAASSSKNLNSFLRNQNFNDSEKNLALIEGAWAYHTVQHNHSFRSTDCTTKLIKKCFNEKFACARTKSEAIICNIFTPLSLNSIANDVSSVNFLTIYSDCSNHGCVKFWPILGRYFLPKQGIVVKIFEIKQLPGETSDIITSYIKEVLIKYEIANKLLALCADNTNCNFGGAARKGKNNVFYKMKESIGRDLIGVNCAGHIVNNCIQSAVENLPLDVEVVIVKIYSFFYIYSVRIEKLKELCDSINVEYKKLLGFSKTRWLSLRPAIERVLKLFPALKSFFLSQEKCPTILRNLFQDPCAEVWLIFVHSQSSTFHNYIIQIESENISMIEVAIILKELKFKLIQRRN